MTQEQMPKITFCIPSKSNVRYLKTCIPSIRKNAYRTDHDIIIFVDSDTDGTVEWLETVKDKYNLTYYVNPDLGNTLYGIGKAYDFCVEKSHTDIFMIFHADMMLGKHADYYAYKHLTEKTVVCSTRVEPPLHPNNGEKILMDFGLWPEDFNEIAFDRFVESQLTETYVTDGIFAPWMMYKDEFLSIGGHDYIMKSAREDSDVFNRLLLSGFTFVQPWNSLVYHLTGRGGQFQHGELSQELELKSAEWKQLMMNSTREFVRKWGTVAKHSPLMHPMVSPRYNINFIVHNCDINFLSLLEPWCDKIFVDCDIEEYIAHEQPNTEFDLRKRLVNTESEINADIIVEFDVKHMSQDDFNLLQQLPDIIKDSGALGKFELGVYTITINALTEYQSHLSRLDSEWYINKLKRLQYDI